MKKLICLLLCALLVLSLAGCGQTKKVEEALEGVWSAGVTYQGIDIEMQLIFDNGKVTSRTVMQGEMSEDLVSRGTYEVTEEAVLLRYEDGNESAIGYTMEDGEPVFDMPNNMVKE